MSYQQAPNRQLRHWSSLH